MTKVFLGGTCNSSTWRDELIPHLKVDYFNPVVEDWTLECRAIEMEQKDNVCDVHLYVITHEMVGVFSIAEVVDSVHREGVRTILQVLPDGFGERQLKSLQAVVDLVNLRGGIAYLDDSIDRTAKLLNPTTN